MLKETLWSVTVLMQVVPANGLNPSYDEDPFIFRKVIDKKPKSILIIKRIGNIT